MSASALQLSYESRIRNAFALFDKDGSGALSVEELRSVLTRPGSGGPTLTDADVASIIADFDTNGDGEISLEEFAPLWEAVIGGDAQLAADAPPPDLPSKTERRIRAAFSLFDTDGSGSLSVDELKAVLTRPGSGLQQMSDEDVAGLIREFDANGGALRRQCTRSHVML